MLIGSADSQAARVYVSIDIDALDVPLVPGCVSAEPGGLRYEELREALFALAERTDVRKRTPFWARTRPGSSACQPDGEAAPHTSERS